MGNKQNRKIKVIRIVSRLNIGGPSIHAKILTEGMDRTRFETKLLVGTLSEHEGDMSYLIESSNGQVVNILSLQREINPIKDILAFIDIFKVIMSEKPDVVHTHMAKAGAIGRCAAVLCNIIFNKKIKIVHTFHGHVLEGYFSPTVSKVFLKIERMIAKFTDTVIAISQTQKWELTAKYNLLKPNKIQVINLGFNLNPFIEKNTNKGGFRNKIGVDPNCLLVGIVGRLVPIKNHTLFLDAVKLCMDNNPGVEIKSVVVGDGELREQLEKYSRGIGIQNDVIFCGWEKDIEHVFEDLDILLLTSDNEGTPVSIIEAMASSVPVVTTGVGGVKDLLGPIENGVNDKNNCNVCERGILCPKGNSKAVASGVQYLIENDNQHRVSRATKYVLENYTDNQLVNNMERLYEDLVQSRTVASGQIKMFETKIRTNK